MSQKPCVETHDAFTSALDLRRYNDEADLLLRIIPKKQHIPVLTTYINTRSHRDLTLKDVGIVTNEKDFVFSLH